MARETKVGLIVGLGVILFVSIFVSDYLSVPKYQEALGSADISNFHEGTTNQPQFVIANPGGATGESEHLDPGRFAAASLDQVERRQGPPSNALSLVREPEPIDPPFRRGAPGLPVNDDTPLAQQPIHAEGREPIVLIGANETQEALSHQLENSGRPGPGGDRAEIDQVLNVKIDTPQEITPAPAQVEHKVARGENLTMIARKYYEGDGNMWRSIRDANPGKVGVNGEVVEGSVLTIPKRSTATANGDTLGKPTAGNEKPVRPRVRIIKVQAGQTLSEIAAEHLGSSGDWPRIMEVNKDTLDSPRSLREGMELRIPVDPIDTVAQQANEALANQGNTPREATPQQQQQAQKTTPPTGNTYTVQSGDNLYKIATKALGSGERYKEIFEANRDKLSSADDIRVGMVLKLPTR